VLKITILYQTYSLNCALSNSTDLLIDTGEKRLNIARPADPTWMDHPRTSLGHALLSQIEKSFGMNSRMARHRFAL
jgi:hypothetical protein